MLAQKELLQVPLRKTLPPVKRLSGVVKVCTRLLEGIGACNPLNIQQGIAEIQACMLS